MTLFAPPLQTGRLTVLGRTLLDEHGRQVLLRGVNAGGRSKMEPFMPFEFAGENFSHEKDRFFDRLTSWGINVLRMPFSWEALEPERGRIDEVYLERYGELIESAWRRGMRTIVDFHQDVFASPFCGDGFPLWTLEGIEHGDPRNDGADGAWFQQYNDPTSAVNAAFERLWTNEGGLFDAFTDMWRLMARTFAPKPGVIGFEIINEPGWGKRDPFEFERTLLVSALEKVGRAILAEAPHALIFGGGPGADALMATTSMTNPELPNFVYAPHYYNPYVATGGNYTQNEKTFVNVAKLASFGEEWNRPVLFGEFGGSHHSPDVCAFIRDVYDAFDRTLSHATMWEASFSPRVWNNELLTIVHPDGTERPVVDELVRPFARAIDGTITRMFWDATERRFELEVKGASGRVSEIVLPSRHLGFAPTVRLTAGDARFDTSRELLFVRAAANYKLTVTA